MTPAEALREANLAGRFNQFAVTSHCLKRMAERSVTRRDICLALQSAMRAELQQNGKWKIAGGVDDESEPLDVVIVFTGPGVIVSVF